MWKTEAKKRSQKHLKAMLAEREKSIVMTQEYRLGLVIIAVGLIGALNPRLAFLEIMMVGIAGYGALFLAR